MDSSRFDTLTRSLTEAANRRGLLGLLATLPLLGSLFALLDPGESDAQGRRRKRHQRGKQDGLQNRLDAEKKKRKKKKCKPKPLTTTCAGKCGSVKNNCKKTVDCGSCACKETCKACFLCQEGGPNIPGKCVIDPDKQEQACGDPGQVCQPDGACVCDADSCACGTCQGDGTCTVASNFAMNQGGGLFIASEAEATLSGCEVVGNGTLETGTGGGIQNDGGTVVLQDGTVVCANGPDPCAGFSDPACQVNCTV